MRRISKKSWPTPGSIARIRKRQILIAVSVVLLAAPTYPPNWQWSAPRWAVEAFSAAGVSRVATSTTRFVVANHVNPHILFGDFDGDQKTDAAVLVRETSASKVGIVIALQDGAVDIIGAGTLFGNGGADFDWLELWYTYTKRPVERGADGTDPPTLLGDALFVEKSESASAIIYYTGSGYSWYQQGD